MHLLVLGLDNAGKTAVLYCLKLGEEVTTTMPTLGFNVEELQVGNHTIRAFDLGGQTVVRDMWHLYYEGTGAILFVIDFRNLFSGGGRARGGGIFVFFFVIFDFFDDFADETDRTCGGVQDHF